MATFLVEATQTLPAEIKQFGIASVKLHSHIPWRRQLCYSFVELLGSAFTFQDQQGKKKKQHLLRFKCF